MKIFRAIIIFAGITIFVNGNFSKNEESAFNKLNADHKIEQKNEFDDLVNAFDNAIKEGEVELFYNELNSAKKTQKN